MAKDWKHTSFKLSVSSKADSDEKPPEKIGRFAKYICIVMGHKWLTGWATGFCRRCGVKGESIKQLLDSHYNKAKLDTMAAMVPVFVDDAEDAAEPAVVERIKLPQKKIRKEGLKKNGKG